MDDRNNQNNQQQQDDQRVTVQTSPAQQPQPGGQGVSVPLVGKEIEPSPVSEFVKASEQEPSLSPEVQEAGVAVRGEHPKLTHEHHAVGMHHAKESVPVRTEPTGTVTLPMTPKQAAMVIKKKKNVKNSLLWLAYLVQYVVEKMQYNETMMQKTGEKEERQTYDRNSGDT